MEIHECENTINSVFSKLINEQKHWEIRFDEIQQFVTKTSNSLLRNQVMGYSHGNLQEYACYFYCSNEEGPDFLCRLTPLSK